MQPRNSIRKQRRHIRCFPALPKRAITRDKRFIRKSWALLRTNKLLPVLRAYKHYAIFPKKEVWKIFRSNLAVFVIIVIIHRQGVNNKKSELNYIFIIHPGLMRRARLGIAEAEKAPGSRVEKRERERGFDPDDSVIPFGVRCRIYLIARP